MSTCPLLLAPTVVTGETRPSLLCHHNSDETVAADCSPVTTEGYRPLVQRRIVVVGIAISRYAFIMCEYT
jgi:hypothetical protein